MIGHFHYKTLGSTQDKALELLEASEQAPFFVTADSCTALRGRRGRHWEYESDRSLAMSLALVSSNTIDLSGFSLTVGLAVLQALNLEGLSLKWPNDIMREGDKIGGILIDSRFCGSGFQIIVGIGINLFDLDASSYRGLGQNKEPRIIAEKVVEFWTVFQEKGFSYFREGFLKNMWGRDTEIDFEIASGEIKRVWLRSVDGSGRLELEAGGTLELQSSGEILFESLS